MTNVPDQFVIGGIKDVMQCNRQFDHSEACPQMTARDRDRVDRLRAQFIGNLSKVPRIDTAQIAGLLIELRMLAVGSVRNSSLGAVML